ncbi:hypothetical protein [Euzebya tangerina]|uniref:hypothetical protein n=1 Tax=Euzebya tangerina TaxID=591198 RepID=UPI000E30F0E1|nr:hypothetical protein [Euzebya tangerina]
MSEWHHDPTEPTPENEATMKPGQTNPMSHGQLEQRLRAAMAARADQVTPSAQLRQTINDRLDRPHRRARMQLGLVTAAVALLAVAVLVTQLTDDPDDALIESPDVELVVPPSSDEATDEPTPATEEAIEPASPEATESATPLTAAPTATPSVSSDPVATAPAAPSTTGEPDEPATPTPEPTSPTTAAPPQSVSLVGGADTSAAGSLAEGESQTFVYAVEPGFFNFLLNDLEAPVRLAVGMNGLEPQPVEGVTYSVEVGVDVGQITVVVTGTRPGEPVEWRARVILSPDAPGQVVEGVGGSAQITRQDGTSDDVIELICENPDLSVRYQMASGAVLLAQGGDNPSVELTTGEVESVLAENVQRTGADDVVGFRASFNPDVADGVVQAEMQHNAGIGPC